MFELDRAWSHLRWVRGWPGRSVGWGTWWVGDRTNPWPFLFDPEKLNPIVPVSDRTRPGVAHVIRTGHPGLPTRPLDRQAGPPIQSESGREPDRTVERRGPGPSNGPGRLWRSIRFHVSGQEGPIERTSGIETEGPTSSIRRRPPPRSMERAAFHTKERSRGEVGIPAIGEEEQPPPPFLPSQIPLWGGSLIVPRPFERAEPERVFRRSIVRHAQTLRAWMVLWRWSNRLSHSSFGSNRRQADNGGRKTAKAYVVELFQAGVRRAAAEGVGQDWKGAKKLSTTVVRTAQAAPVYR